jgi:glycerate dehydrogenase
VAQAGRGFGMKVLVAERRRAAAVREGRVPFYEVLRRSDLLAVLCPLTPETRGLIGTAEPAAMKRGALVINCARGGIVDEVALAEALVGGRIGGAGIDSLETEPPSPDNPPLSFGSRPVLPSTLAQVSSSSSARAGARNSGWC